MKPDNTAEPKELTALELESQVSVDKAAKIKGISRDTFERVYAHLIRRPSPRRCTVKLKDVLEA